MISNLFNQNVHVPKSYHRFAGLIEKLYQEQTITSNNEILLSIKRSNIC